MHWRRLSTRDARPSPLVSVAASTAARRTAVRWTAAQRGSCALAPPHDSRPPSVASRLIAVWTAARRAVRLAAVRWTAAQLGSCVLAPPLDSRRPSVASCLRRRLDSGAARQQCAGAAIDSRPPSVASRLIAVWTAARRAVRPAALRWTAARLGSYVLAPPSTQRAASRRSGADNAKGLVQRFAQPRPH